MAAVKTADDFFSDWESHVFGYGYGTGEAPVLMAVRGFFDAFEEDGRSYRYEKLEQALGVRVAWLLINTMAHADVIEYGTSPRYGWLTDSGSALGVFVRSKTLDELVDLANRDNEYTHCMPDRCNCEFGPCRNPFWPWRTRG